MTVAGRPEVDRGALVLAGGLGLVGASVFLGGPVAPLAATIGLGGALLVSHRTVLSWPAMVAFFIAIMLFVPVGRYSIPFELPFADELYRLAVVLVIAVWAGSLLIDPSVRLRRSPFDLPVAIIVCGVLGSIVVNLGRVVPLQGAVLKTLTFFLSFVLVYYFIVSVVRSRSTIERLLKFLVTGTSVVAVAGVVEQRTDFNVFDHVAQVLPFLQFQGPVEEDARGGLLRAVASSGHPIELGVLLVISIPLALALVHGSGRRWWIPTVILAIGVMSSASRTPILAGAAAGLVLLVLRPREVKSLIPLLVPLVIVVKVVAPGSIATVKNAFFPQGGLVQEATQLSRESDPLLAGGRVRQIGPSLSEASRTPLLGQGIGTRQTGFNNPLRNAPILDNQWLGLLLELGLVGIIGWATLFYRSVARLGRASRRRAGPEGWLPAALAASIAGFGVAMFTFDAFAFIQVTFVFWVLIALSASLLLTDNVTE